VTTVEAFRQKARRWLDDNAAAFAATGPHDLAAGRPFRRALWDAGLLGITLDAAYGGQGLTADHQKAWDDEAAAYPLPAMGEPVTTGICAPTLLDFGTEEQKRTHIAPMMRGDEVWTQLLSEPGAGSDLAGLQTRATRDGDEYVLSGQKVWTSGAHESDFALCVARTDPTLPKHRGLSMFIVDLRAPGVTIRPLRQMTGDAHFNEVFLDDVRVPVENRIGDENKGWTIAKSLLGHERITVGSPSSAEYGLQLLRSLAREQGVIDDPVFRERYGQVALDVAHIRDAYARFKTMIARGEEIGPDVSMLKILSSETFAEIADLIIETAGDSGGMAPSLHDAGKRTVGVLTSLYRARPMLIYAGANEIQRNIIATAVLGLPRA
jgi:alkylation response protein AidB-like acyl-CoA dehydrogenase